MHHAQNIGEAQIPVCVASKNIQDAMLHGR